MKIWGSVPIFLVPFWRRLARHKREKRLRIDTGTESSGELNEPRLSSGETVGEGTQRTRSPRAGVPSTGAAPLLSRTSYEFSPSRERRRVKFPGNEDGHALKDESDALMKWNDFIQILYNESFLRNQKLCKDL